MGRKDERKGRKVEGREEGRGIKEVREGREKEGKEGRKEGEEGRSKKTNESSPLAAILSSIIPGRSPTVMH